MESNKILAEIKDLFKEKVIQNSQDGVRIKPEIRVVYETKSSEKEVPIRAPIEEEEKIDLRIIQENDDLNKQIRTSIR